MLPMREYHLMAADDRSIDPILSPALRFSVTSSSPRPALPEFYRFVM